MGILNLEELKVLQVKETDNDYCIIAESEDKPFIVCPHCFKMNQYVSPNKFKLFQNRVLTYVKINVIISHKLKMDS